MKEKIIELLQKHLDDNRLFIASVDVSQSKTRSNVTILLDSDTGITIDECGKISRKLGNEIEELNLIEDAFTLEVSSPGIDQPLKLHRQYLKNIGRSVKVLMKDGTEKKGVLNLVTETGIGITEEKKKKVKGQLPSKKENSEEQIQIAFSEIEQTKIQVSFK